MAAAASPAEKGKARVNALKARLAQARAARAAGAMRLKRAAQQAVDATPLRGTKVVGAFEDVETETSGVSQMPDLNERLEAREEQVEKSRKARSNGLLKLKQTTMRAVETLRDTTFLSRNKLQARLAVSGNGATTPDPD